MRGLATGITTIPCTNLMQDNNNIQKLLRYTLGILDGIMILLTTSSNKGDRFYDSKNFTLKKYIYISSWGGGRTKFCKFPSFLPNP